MHFGEGRPEVIDPKLTEGRAGSVLQLSQPAPGHAIAHMVIQAWARLQKMDRESRQKNHRPAFNTTASFSTGMPGRQLAHFWPDRRSEGKRKKRDLNQRRPRKYCPPEPAPNPPRTRLFLWVIGVTLRPQARKAQQGTTTLILRAGPESRRCANNLSRHNLRFETYAIPRIRFGTDIPDLYQFERKLPLGGTGRGKQILPGFHG
jgi:hypothetical protein